MWDKFAKEDVQPTSDLFSECLQVHEKHEWFPRELLKQNDGLTGSKR